MTDTHAAVRIDRTWHAAAVPGTVALCGLPGRPPLLPSTLLRVHRTLHERRAAGVAVCEGCVLALYRAVAALDDPVRIVRRTSDTRPTPA